MIKKLILIFAMCSALMAIANEPYTIYPVPHEQVMGNADKASFTKKINIISEHGIDNVTFERAMQVLIPSIGERPPRHTQKDPVTRYPHFC